MLNNYINIKVINATDDREYGGKYEEVLSI